MTSWEQFEIEWTNFLKKTYGDVAYFQHMGGPDSTKPDILVKTKTGKSFYIEAKECPAQCGQFVLLPNIKTKQFEYSPRNIEPKNSFAEEIIKFMNRYFESFRNAGTAGRTIEFDGMEQVFTNWIKQKYGNEGVELFATNNRKMLPIEKFSEYFNVTATYRIKRSGSSNVGSTRIRDVSSYIESNFEVYSKKVTENGSLFYKSNKNLHNQRFTLNDYEYMFSYGNGEFEIRKLSNTYNANVIFSISLKSPSPSGMTKEEILDFLK